MKRSLPVRRSVDALMKSGEFSVQGRPLTARAVADLCGVELKTVHNWVLEGRIEHFRTPGRHLRFQRLAVHEFLLRCGYEAAPSGKAERSAIVVRGGSSAALRTVLRALTVTEVDDLPSAVITAARNDPEWLIVDLTPRQVLPDTATLRALAQLMPNVRVVLFGRKSQATSASLHGAKVVVGVSNLLHVVQELTSR